MDTNSASRTNDQTPRISRSLANILTVSLSLNFFATISAVLFEAVSHRADTFADVAGNFLDSFVYSNSIGLLLGAVIFRVTLGLRNMVPLIAWPIVTLLIFACALIGSFVAGFTLMALGAFPAGDFSWIDFQRMGFGFLLAYIFGFSIFAYEKVRLQFRVTALELRAREVGEERAQKLAFEASLSSLESRLHPHFLFNTLNSICSLVREDPELAEQTIGRLATLLRFSLDSRTHHLITLDQELKLAIDYLSIESARFRDRLDHDVQVQVGLGSALVPPFVVQTLVENSVKHAVAVERSGAKIYVRAAREDSTLAIEVWDTGPGFSETQICTGHGLDTLRSRLHTIFTDLASLRIERKEGITVVRVSIPLGYRDAGKGEVQK